MLLDSSSKSGDPALFKSVFIWFLLCIIVFYVNRSKQEVIMYDNRSTVSKKTPSASLKIHLPLKNKQHRKLFRRRWTVKEKLRLIRETEGSSTSCIRSDWPRMQHRFYARIKYKEKFGSIKFTTRIACRWYSGHNPSNHHRYNDITNGSHWWRQW